MRLAETAPRSVHSADCTIWETPPDAQPDALLAAGINEDEVVRYCGEVRPVYDAFKRVLGQLSGVLLLAQTGADDPAWRESILDTAKGQIEAARDRLATLRPSRPAQRHYDALVRLAAQLEALHAEIRGETRLVGAEREWDRLVSELFSVHRGLLAVSEPRAGMTPVDFSHACCSCGAPRRTVEPRHRPSR